MPTQNYHELLFCPATLTLGEIHLILLRSTNLIEKYRDSEEIGLDEIAWWVFHRELNHDELRAHTETALKSAQMLKKVSEKLGRNQPRSYKELILTLREFAESRAEEVQVLLEYVHWLAARDALTPGILFTY